MPKIPLITEIMSLRVDPRPWCGLRKSRSSRSPRLERDILATTGQRAHNNEHLKTLAEICTRGSTSAILISVLDLRFTYGRLLLSTASQVANSEQKSWQLVSLAVTRPCRT